MTSDLHRKCVSLTRPVWMLILGSSISHRYRVSENEDKGRVVVIGSRGTVEIDPRDLMVREATVMGALLFSTSPSEYREIHAALSSGLARGLLDPVIGRGMPLKEAPQAHREVMESRAYSKIVLIP